MTTEVERLLDLAVQLPAHQRAQFLVHRCPDPRVRIEVESLLQYATSAETFLDQAIRDAALFLRTTAELSPGDWIGPYQIVSLIGRGGMGMVYLAERADGAFHQRVAVKVVQSANARSLLDRFQQERRILALLNHPNIARILDGGQTPNGLPYFVMEYVSGQTIDRFCEKNNLSLRNRLKLFLKVCDAVRHAHQNLIVHRDLKPANIFVTEAGEPKLLDFGIAKVLDPAHLDSSSTGFLTFAYASPEQVRGGPITTATDVYSLGAVLYKILTGQSPHESDIEASRRAEMISGTRHIPPGRLNPKLPSDINYLLRKALRNEPEERYVSVEAFANDIRAFLNWQPIHARSGELWYRTRKFLRRYRVVVTAATITIAGLSLGLYTATRERAVAQRRFLQVRQLANKVLALDEVIGGLHRSTKARHEIVAMSKEYLEALGAEAHRDRDLALEIGEAYSLLARAQGVSVVANLGQQPQAEESLRKAETFVEPLLSESLDNRKALLTSARISHDRMILAETSQLKDEALMHARKAVGQLDRLSGLGKLSEAESQTASELFYNVALAHKNLYLLDDGIRYARRSIEMSRFLPNTQLRLSLGLSLLADFLRLTGDLEAALQAIREARVTLDKAQFPSEMVRRSSWFTVLWREGKILGATSGISLNRSREAIAVLQRAFNLVEEWTRNDREDAWSRLEFASVGRELGDLLRLRDPQRALAVYDHALFRLREIKNNAQARRGEVEILAGSAYALRRLNRIGEAKGRIDAAFRLLSETQEYPADQVIPHTGADAALRALGDHLAETGQPRRAVEVYEDLLAKIMAAKPDPRNDLRHAVALSHIYESLAVLHRRNGRHDRREALSSLRQELWRQWVHKLPDKRLIRREFDAASRTARLLPSTAPPSRRMPPIAQSAAP